MVKMVEMVGREIGKIGEIDRILTPAAHGLSKV